ncbi:hypothetical protein SAMN02910292_02884 [Lachnospiraceae bacterium XBB2008]|nr:hypothetical protein SAMN02910292_02884 [Lachnospiraceae bacterium XBB2008]
MFKDKMVTPAIPERVYTLCKIVEKEPLSSSEIKEKMEPEYLANGTVYYNDYKNAAEELGLITISDDLISLAVSPKTIKTIENMRAFINSELEKFNNGQFYLVTNAYYEKGSDILKEDKNIANLAPMFAQITGVQVDAVAMRAWRFWAAFLGFGYLQDMFIIPNANVFLKDVILSSGLEKGKMYSTSEFVEAILPMASIVIPDPNNRKFNYGVSNGLRTLQDEGFIKMEHILDQKDMWTLYPLIAYSNDSTITNIKIV